MHSDGGAARQRPGSLIALGLWAGILTGFAEVAKLLATGWEVPMERSRDLGWMIPAVDAGVFALIGGALALLDRRLKVPWPVAAGIFGGVGTTLVLLLFPGLHPLAAIVIGAGAGLQLGKLATRRAATGAALVGRSLPWLVGSVAVVCLGTLGWRLVREYRMVATRVSAAAKSPNVLLLILDTVRAPNLSLYGYARETTPELEQLARDATVFESAFAAAPWTLPSHASIFTGMWAFNLEVTCRRGLGHQARTLAEVLRARGYATAAFVANTSYAGWESGFARGFERYHDYPVTLRTAFEATALGEEVYPDVRRFLTLALNRLPLLWRLHLPPPQRFPSAAEISRSFLDWYDSTRPEPFFAFLNFMDAHQPYLPPDSFRYRFRSPIVRPLSPWAWSDNPPVTLTPADVRPRQDMYDGSIAYLDSELGKLFRELDRLGVLDNTVVIVTADHGEEFAEHGVVNHGNTLYRLSLHVPLVVRFPGRVPGGRRVWEPISLRNLGATILDLVDSPPALPGRSLTRFWTGGDASPDTVIASVRQSVRAPSCYPAGPGNLSSIAVGNWRYIRREGSGSEELYDFRHDVLERWNRASSPEGVGLVRRYRAALDAILADSATAVN